MEDGASDIFLTSLYKFGAPALPKGAHRRTAYQWLKKEGENENLLDKKRKNWFWTLILFIGNDK